MESRSTLSLSFAAVLYASIVDHYILSFVAGMQNVLELAAQHNLRVFAPSTIAGFGTPWISLTLRPPLISGSLKFLCL